MKGTIRAIPETFFEGLLVAAGVLGGKIVARKVRSMLPAAYATPGTLVGSLVEVGTGGVAGGLVKGFAPAKLKKYANPLGLGLIAGGITAPAETFIQNHPAAQTAGLSAILADDGYLVGGRSGVQLVSAEPSDYRQTLSDQYVGGYVSGGNPVVDQYLESVRLNTANAS